jgi:hypothetical protein
MSTMSNCAVTDTQPTYINVAEFEMNEWGLYFRPGSRCEANNPPPLRLCDPFELALKADAKGLTVRIVDPEGTPTTFDLSESFIVKPKEGSKRVKTALEEFGLELMRHKRAVDLLNGYVEQVFLYLRPSPLDEFCKT